MSKEQRPAAVVEFLEKVSKTFPESRLEEDEPKDYQTGFWFVDVHLGEFLVVVEWRPNQGFGLRMIRGDERFGVGPDCAFPSIDESLSLMTKMFSGNYDRLRAGEDDSPLIQ